MSKKVFFVYRVLNLDILSFPQKMSGFFSEVSGTSCFGRGGQGYIPDKIYRKRDIKPRARGTERIILRREVQKGPAKIERVFRTANRSEFFTIISETSPFSVHELAFGRVFLYFDFDCYYADHIYTNQKGRRVPYTQQECQTAIDEFRTACGLKDWVVLECCRDDKFSQHVVSHDVGFLCEVDCGQYVWVLLDKFFSSSQVSLKSKRLFYIMVDEQPYEKEHSLRVINSVKLGGTSNPMRLATQHPPEATLISWRPWTESPFGPPTLLLHSKQWETLHFRCRTFIHKHGMEKVVKNQPTMFWDSSVPRNKILFPYKWWEEEENMPTRGMKFAMRKLWTLFEPTLECPEILKYHTMPVNPLNNVCQHFIIVVRGRDCPVRPGRHKSSTEQSIWIPFGQPVVHIKCSPWKSKCEGKIRTWNIVKKEHIGMLKKLVSV